MSTVKLSRRGTIEIPKILRDRYGWKAGQEFSVEQFGGGVLFSPRLFPEMSVDEVYGCLHYDGPALSETEMAEAVNEEIRDVWRPKTQRSEGA